MSVRQSLLVLLDEQPSYGYQLRAEFERRTGGTWPLNIGQVYSTLDRLERDGLVEQIGRNDDGQKHYAITEAGRAATRHWFDSPVTRTGATRDELAVKIALAVARGDVDLGTVIQTQRTASLRVLQDLTRMKMAASEPVSADEVAWSLVLESMIFAVEAEVRWLDHSESTIARRRTESAAPTSPPVADGVGRSQRTATQ